MFSKCVITALRGFVVAKWDLKDSVITILTSFFHLSGPFLITIRPQTVASSVRHLVSSLEMCCMCWTVEMRSGGRPVRSAPRMRLRRSASSRASTGQTWHCECGWDDSPFVIFQKLQNIFIKAKSKWKACCGKSSIFKMFCGFLLVGLKGKNGHVSTPKRGYVPWPGLSEQDLFFQTASKCVNLFPLSVCRTMVEIVWALRVISMKQKCTTYWPCRLTFTHVTDCSRLESTLQ